MRLTTPAKSALLGALMLAGVTTLNAAPVSFQTADHVTVFADYQGNEDKTKPIVLLFHQAGSNRGEYSGIQPRLVALGYNTLSVDQRSGGTGHGRQNETVAKLGHSTGFSDALPDLIAAVDWTKVNGYSGKVIVWGSSYSASLVFLLAAREPRISAVISFSPGEYFSDANIVHRAAANVRQPILVSSAGDSGEIAQARSILAASPAASKTQLAPRLAGHGSSALDGPAAAEIWPAVERFLSQ